MPSVEETIAAIGPMDAGAACAAQARLDGKTKPRGSLGRLEELACRIAAITGHVQVADLDKVIVVMGADHGVALEGVSAFPQAVTAQMLLNFARGGAAISVLAKQAGARVCVVDMGIVAPLPATPGILARRIGAGTANFVQGPAMTAEQARRGVEVGIELAAELSGQGVGLIGLGEMGIGNTTAASAVTAALTGAELCSVTGSGTGVAADALAHKREVIARALRVNAPAQHVPLDVLAKVGGFELAGLCGLTLGAAAHRIPVLMDGFIASSAALLAVRMAPAAGHYLIASHQSVEPGHAHVLRELDQRPLFDLGLRLGEGTGAALAMGLVDAAIAIQREMATFGDAGVSDGND